MTFFLKKKTHQNSLFISYKYCSNSNKKIYFFFQAELYLIFFFYLLEGKEIIFKSWNFLVIFLTLKEKLHCLPGR